MPNRYVRFSTPGMPRGPIPVAPPVAVPLAHAPLPPQAPSNVHPAALPQMGSMAAPPEAQGHSILPWLMMALLQHSQGAGKEAPLKGGVAPDTHSKELGHFEKRAAAPSALKSLPTTTGSRTFTKGSSQEATPRPTAHFSSPAAQESASLSTSQSREAVTNPPVTPANVAPISRSADVRDDSAAVSRSVDHKARAYVKRTGLVNPAERLAQKALEPRLSVFRKPSHI